MRGVRALRNLKLDDVMAWLFENDGIDFLTKGAEFMGRQRLLGRKVIPVAARAVSFYCSPDAAVLSKAKNLHIDEKRRGVVKCTPLYAKSK